MYYNVNNIYEKNIKINKFSSKLENIKFCSFTFDKNFIKNFIKNTNRLKLAINSIELKGPNGPLDPISTVILICTIDISRESMPFAMVILE